MVDQNTFINTYIDIIINSLVENIKTNLQLQTQIKCHELVVADKDKAVSAVTVEKDQIIAALQERLGDNRVAEDWRIKYEAAEANYSAVMGKLKHMDAALAQVAELKHIIATKDSEITTKTNEVNNLRTRVAELETQFQNFQAKDSKKVINTKTKKKEEDPVLVEAEKQEKETDDF